MRRKDQPGKPIATRGPAVIVVAVGACLAAPAWSGPPYLTDDPEPVPYQHFEFHLATQHEVTRDGASGTAPHFELNYGAVPNLQLHLIAPLAYARPSQGPSHYGPGDVELGAKFRFIQESEQLPMVGTFPVLELPVGDVGRGPRHGSSPRPRPPVAAEEHRPLVELWRRRLCVEPGSR